VSSPGFETRGGERRRARALRSLARRQAAWEPYAGQGAESRGDGRTHRWRSPRRPSLVRQRRWVDQTTFEARPTEWRRALDDAELGEGERPARGPRRDRGRRRSRAGPAVRARGSLLPPRRPASPRDRRERRDQVSLAREYVSGRRRLARTPRTRSRSTTSGSRTAGSRCRRGRCRARPSLLAISGRRPGPKARGPRGRSRRR
jgi:hypothetical protein